MSNYFYDLSTTSKHRNRYIVPSTPGGLHIINVPELLSSSGLEAVGLGKGGAWIYPGTLRIVECHAYLDVAFGAESDHVASSLFVAADFDSDDGRGILKEALESLVCGYFSCLN
jgi:UDP-glucose:glycoprotein glucosyltransferase